MSERSGHRFQSYAGGFRGKTNKIIIPYTFWSSF